MKKYMLFVISLLTITVAVSIASGYPNFGKKKGGCPCCAAKGTKANVKSKSSATEKLVLNYYLKKYGDRNVEVKIKDFGCHMEAFIMKGNKLVKKLSISGKNITEIN